MGEAMRSKLLFVITDGGRARLVEQSAETGDFATVEEIDNQTELARLRHELRASPQARTINSQGDRRHGVGRDEYLRAAKEVFIAQVAERAASRVRQRNLAGVVLAAPRRLIGPLRGGLEGQVAIAEVLAKDLTKAPDHELNDWFAPVARRRFQPEAGR